MNIDVFIPPRRYEAVFVANVDGTNIGTTGLYVIDWVRKTAEFRIALLLDWINKGYGTKLTAYVINYGFNELGLDSIWLGVEKDNKIAVKLYEKSGFVPDNIFKMVIRRDTPINKASPPVGVDKK